MSQPDNSQLLRFITDNFGLEDLKTLCFNLGVEFDDLGGEGREGKARELVKWLQNRSRLDHLVAHLSIARPEQYRQRFHETPFISPTPARLRRDPRQVFISHAHQDGAWAQKLARDLQARGYPIWIAPNSIRIGEDWPDAIDRGLDESGVVVVALTPAAMTSYWVRKETSAARLLEGRGLVRLVLLDVAECDLPSSWLTYQFANFRDDYAAGLNQLLQALDGAPTPAAPVETGRRPVSTLSSDAKPIPREQYVKEEQWRQLQALAHEIATALGRQSGDDELREVYRRFNRQFGLTTYKKLPRRRFSEGLAFLMAWRDEVMAATPVETGRQPVSTPDVEPAPHVETGRRPASTTSPDRRIHDKTGIELIRIPAGPFLYGSSDNDTMARDDEKPQRTIDLSEYWIGRTPVTNAQYKRFIDANPDHPVPFSIADRDKPYNWDKTHRTFPRNKADHPIVLVNWHDAKAYCDWAGLRLPNEAQWEKAARGTDGRLWPWGNEPATSERCNFDGNIGGTSPVEQYSPSGDSPYGCVDTVGNVWEWTGSWYLTDRTPALRSSSWQSNHVLTTRVAFRGHNDPLTRVNHGGFRAVEVTIEDEDSIKELKATGIDAIGETASTTTTINGRDAHDKDQVASLGTELDQLPPLPVSNLPPGFVTRASSSSQLRIHEKTGIELLRIPAGPFLYGSSDADTMARDNEKPQRTVDLPEYWIGRAPVTNAQYKLFLDANPEHRVPLVDHYTTKSYNWDEMQRSYPADKADHPVVLVTWFDAKAFCDWAGLLLPSEEQWEKAARGTDGRIWPWGNEPPTAEHCNFRRNVGGTTPVGMYSPKSDSSYGCTDMAGNVWEWTASRRDNNEHWRMLRGGSWGETSENCRCARRTWYPPDYPFIHFGFRVLDAQP